MSANRYLHVESRKNEGAHYTPTRFANFISEQMLSRYQMKESIRIVDPAVGDGELLISLIKKIKACSGSNIEVYGFDTNAVSVAVARKRLKDAFPKLIPHLHCKDFLELCLEKGGIQRQGDLFSSTHIPDFDLLIANPPYIRTQTMGAEQSQLLSQKFGLKGRVDIYQAFLVAMQAVLKPHGIAGVIVSNRFLSTKGASRFREIVYRQYEIKGIWDFGDTKVFEAAVLPAVMILSPCPQPKNYNPPFYSVYEASTTENRHSNQKVKDQIDAIKYPGAAFTQQNSYWVRHGHLCFDHHPSDVWRLQDQRSKRWLEEVTKNTWCTFKDVGKIRVGVKTTADNVFIRSDWIADIGYEPELLKPIITHHVSGRFRAGSRAKKAILYTHTFEDGRRRPFDIEKYPLSEKYLKKHKPQLAQRSYISKANRKWFEIWVPQNPSLWSKHKIVFRDIAENPAFWMDEEGSVVNGDCYWMLREREDMPDDILWLVLAVANSKFIELFYDIKFQNRLYSGKRRFISQYVENFPIPDPSLGNAKNLVALSKQCYLEQSKERRAVLESKIDSLTWKLFNVSSTRL